MAVAVNTAPWPAVAVEVLGHSSVDRPFIVLTETKSSYRHIPVWAAVARVSDRGRVAEV